jgi:hypothetical protein
MKTLVTSHATVSQMSTGPAFSIEKVLYLGLTFINLALVDYI